MAASRIMLIGLVRPTYVGLDPGEHGACAAWCPTTGTVDILTDRDDLAVARWLRGLKTCVVAAVLEIIAPRPVAWRDKETGMVRSSILRSTCIIYGSYRALRATAVARSIPLLEATPQEWQGGLPIPPRRVKGGETQLQWKRRLRDITKTMFPTVKVTLDNADALLLAVYCRKKMGVE